MRRQLNASLGLDRNEARPYKKSNSNSTQDEKEGSVDKKMNKEKSQLCKKFMENGYCPYEKRCKFAHGLSELRKNNEHNSKYKTKECGSFKNNLFCVYGDRCNFIHVVTPIERDDCECWEESRHEDVEMELIRRGWQKKSKLLTLL